MPRRVVVSGGGTGIGRGVAECFAADGDDVLILGRRGPVLKEAAAAIDAAVGRSVTSWRSVDLSAVDQVERLAQEVSHVEVLVNCAGGVDRSERATLAEVEAAWLRDFRSNVMSAVLLTSALAPKLARPGGRVITLSSIAALRGGGESYSACKAALIGWTYELAATLGPDGITANILAPGFVEGTEFFAGTMTEERRQRLIGQTVTGRSATPEDVAAAARFLASPEAAQVTGQILQVNGGALFGR